MDIGAEMKNPTKQKETRRDYSDSQEYMFQGDIEYKEGGDKFSVHFAVTFLDRLRTSFCVTTIIKAIDLMLTKMS